MTTYTRANPLAISPTGDTRVQGFTKLDTDLTAAFSYITTESGRITTLAAAQTGVTAYDVAVGTRDDLLMTPESAAMLRPHGECRLVKSGSTLKLERVGLGRMWVDGILVHVPVAGLTLSTAGLSENTIYYIYLQSDGEEEYTLSLSASTSTYATDATTGIVTRTGDASKTLVGMARTITGPAWVDTDVQRLVLTYFNQTPRSFKTTLGTDATVTNTSYAEILDSTERVQFLSWGGRPGFVALNVAVVHSGSGYESYAAIRDSIGATYVMDGLPTYFQQTNSQVVRAYAGTSFTPVAGVTQFTVHGKTYNSSYAVQFQADETYMTGILL